MKPDPHQGPRISVWRAVFWPDFSQFDLSDEVRANLPRLLAGLTMLSFLTFAGFSLVTAVAIVRLEDYVVASITAIPALLSVNAVVSSIRAALHFRKKR